MAITHMNILEKNGDGGGVALSAIKDLNPVYVCDGGENAEAVTIDIHLKTMAISVTSAYGPQNNAPDAKKSFVLEVSI